MTSWLWLVAAALAWDELGENARPTGRRWATAERFVAGSIKSPARLAAETDPAALGRVAARTAEAIRGCEERISCSAGAFEELGIGIDRVLATLDLVSRVAEEDQGAPIQRLLDPAWLREHFDVWQWMPDTASASKRKVLVTPRQIRLTKYLVYQVKGSAVRTSPYDTALYASPEGGAVWSGLTRVDAYAGAFEPGGAGAGRLEPLVYLEREGVNQALMQGTVEVSLDDGRVRLFNVHENNGVPWDPHQKSHDLQRRYWTFREVPGVLGVEGAALEPWVSVAGDIHNVGFGKLVALQETDGHGGTKLRLAVLADTGGAFQPNLFQLDWFVGSFPSHAAYEKRVATLPRRVSASVLVAR